MSIVNSLKIRIISAPLIAQGCNCCGIHTSVFQTIDSSKSHVADELELPSQEENICWLSFSAVEEHFDQRQPETCVNFARGVLQRFKSDIHDKGCSGLQNFSCLYI